MGFWDTWVAQWLASAFGSGHDPTTLGSRPTSGSLRETCFSLCLCLCLSVSFMNKIFLKTKQKPRGIFLLCSTAAKPAQGFSVLFLPTAVGSIRGECSRYYVSTSLAFLCGLLLFRSYPVSLQFYRRNFSIINRYTFGVLVEMSSRSSFAFL